MTPLTPETVGRVIITWPAPAENGAVFGWGVTIHDADTGEQLTDATSLLTVAHGSPGSWNSEPLQVTLTRLVDADGKPSSKPVPTDEYKAWKRSSSLAEFMGQPFRVGTFRYLVAEMRVAALGGYAP